MIILGLICDPLKFCKALLEARYKYSINCVSTQPIVICTSMEEFTAIYRTGTKKRILIFGSEESLNSFTLKIIKSKNVNVCLKQVMSENNHSIIKNKKRNIIKYFIDKNNDESISFLHQYNTSLYNITSMPVRDAARSLFFDLIHQRISKQSFDKSWSKLYPKRGKSVIAFDNILAITNSLLFQKAQKAITQAKTKHERDYESIANMNSIAPFDLRYFIYSQK